MKYRIYYNGRYEDSLVVEGETIEEIRKKVFAEESKRGLNKKDCWSEELKE